MAGSVLGSLPWPSVSSLARGSVLVVPLGSTEQHGPHLPLSTDTVVAGELAARLVAARPDMVAAPSLPYGASGEHAGFAGTLSIGTQVLTDVLVELGRSADDFAGVLFLSAHGGNAEAVGRALSKLRGEGRNVRCWAPPPCGTGADIRWDAHAGFTETSLMLALCPDSVRPSSARAGRTEPLSELSAQLRSGGLASVSPNGVLGDPDGASAEAGHRILEAWTAALVSDLAGWPAHD